MDLIVDELVIVELKALEYIKKEHRSQLWNYMNLTHMSHGMLVNFSKEWSKYVADCFNYDLYYYYLNLTAFTSLK